MAGPGDTPSQVQGSLHLDRAEASVGETVGVYWDFSDSGYLANNRDGIGIFEIGEVEYENHLDWKVRGDSRALFGQIKWKLMPHLFEKHVTIVTFVPRLSSGHASCRPQTRQASPLPITVSGGTGSGVGAYVTERLRDEYPHVTIVNQVVWPYASGEVSVQGYNAILTTSHLQKAADAILLFQNDQLHQTCLKRLGLRHVTFTDLNKVISHVLASACSPLCSIGDLCTQLCSHGDYKVVSVKSIPWMPDQCHAYSSHLMEPEAWRCDAWGSGCGFNKHDKCCTLLTNSQGCVRPLNQLCEKAWTMYSAGAYLHQYERYGLTKDEMIERFADVELMIKNYATIT
eukprot:Em0004g50a